MSRIVVIPLPTAAATRSWTVDRDCILLSAYATIFGANAVTISTDPSMTAAIILAAPATSVGIINDFLLALTVNNQANAMFTRIPLSKGMVMYLNGSAGCWVFLSLEDVVVQLATS